MNKSAHVKNEYLYQFFSESITIKLSEYFNFN